MRFLGALPVEQPKLFRTLAEYALNHQIREALNQWNTERDRARALLNEARSMNIALDNTTLEFIVRRQVEDQARTFWENPHDLPELERLDEAVQFAQELPFAVNLWEVQNLSAKNLHGVLLEMQQRADGGDDAAREWVLHAHALADRLRLRVA
jgi:hypothetical protein